MAIFRNLAKGVPSQRSKRRRREGCHALGKLAMPEPWPPSKQTCCDPLSGLVEGHSSGHSGQGETGRQGTGQGGQGGGCASRNCNAFTSSGFIGRDGRLGGTRRLHMGPTASHDLQMESVPFQVSWAGSNDPPSRGQHSQWWAR